MASEWLTASDWSWGRLILQHGVAAVYVVAFVCAARQFRGLLGTRGLLPVPEFLAGRSFRSSPSVFHLHYSDRFFAAVCWGGAGLAAALAAGLTNAVPCPVAIGLWLLLWVAYLSIVNVGQIWYSFGWESLLLETGLLVAFLGNHDTAAPALMMWLTRWLLFRVEFGAGLIKLRGDRCWRDLSALDYHHETQPVPGPLSWFFHHLPRPLHRIEVAGNHVAQLIVPFGLFAPQPMASVAALVIAATQLWLVASGNFAWLNWLTIVLALSVIDVSAVLPPMDVVPHQPIWFTALVIGVAATVVWRSWGPVRNMASRHQRMNRTFDPLHLVNSYGAFGTVSRHRDEVVLEGTADRLVANETVWQEYEFKAKPGDVRRRPRQLSPYHLRLDWLMWFAAISPAYARPWFTRLVAGLLTGDTVMVKLLAHNPFPDEPPRHIRATLYRYRFSTGHELRTQRVWWYRDRLGEYLAPVGRDDVDRLTAPGDRR
ncbi:lipase maturation factor family protein [Mycolicibacterium sp.]|uniref:lipase maturation factor family protein n=1 Tax=Mycolicibacterium sp. TaxID=2320850 RepID=UPI003D126FF2